MKNVIDLDLLRPEPKYVKLGGNQIDVSFIPCGITFEIDELIRKMSGLDQVKVLEGGAETLRAFDMGVELCALFCSNSYSEMDDKWFRENTDPRQIKLLADEIRKTLFAGYEQVAGYSKNGQAAKTKKK